MGNSPLTIRFAVDAMLGRLANHLLHTGYDCYYQDQVDDPELAELADSTDRIILTRDSDFVRNPTLNSEVFVLRETSLQDSLYGLKQGFNLIFHPDFFFTRCADCNRALQPVDKGDVRESIPEGTSEWIEEFYRCNSCGKLYWKGSHHEDLISKLRKWGLLNQTA
ncbi:MAG: Mut7-C RNAse domain-containing protein [bacterium]